MTSTGLCERDAQAVLMGNPAKCVTRLYALTFRLRNNCDTFPAQQKKKLIQLLIITDRDCPGHKLDMSSIEWNGSEPTKWRRSL